MDATTTITITITTGKGGYDPDRATVSTELPCGAGGLSIDVTGPRDQFGQMIPATVNWPAIGSQPAAVAAAFAFLMAKAATVAADMNRASGIEA